MNRYKFYFVRKCSGRSGASLVAPRARITGTIYYKMIKMMSDSAQDGGDQHWLSGNNDVSSEMGFEGCQIIKGITNQLDAPTRAPPALHVLTRHCHHRNEAAAAAIDNSASPVLGNVKGKRKQQQKPLAHKTAAKDRTFNPAPPPAPTPAMSSKKTKLGAFVEIAKSEELTHHKELNLATEEEPGRDRQAWCKERMAKLCIKETKLQHAHKLCMAKFRATTSGTGSLGSSHTSHATSFADQTAGTSYASSEANYSEFGSDFGSLAARPSSYTSAGPSTYDDLFPSIPYTLPGSTTP
ncbi:hypothetical protein K438DRAFT_2097752 [Mycena galopus ATCC 62051]|nr:hypothetical protein K438DRAFT_2097752 [Mycena galopus ATCC 62051]